MAINLMHDVPLGTMRTAPVEMTSDAFRAAGHELVERLAEHLATLRTKRVMPSEKPDEIRELLAAKAQLPEAGADPEGLLRQATELLLRYSTHIAHPRFLGYITSGGTPLGALAELLAAAVNPNVGAWKLSPMATEMEAQSIRWIAELIGFPSGCGGLLVSGGNMANFLGVFAARAAKATWDIRRTGIAGEGSRPMRIYASTQTHTWVQKAADLAGLGTDAIRWIPTGTGQRAEIAALRQMLREDLDQGHLPMMVVGTAGSVSTGAVDPLPAMAEFCRSEDLWFHVDGAYGAIAAGVPGAPTDLEGLREADSLALDPHKWLYSPLEAGCALVRRPEDLLRAFSYHPPYYNFEVEALNYFDYGMQNSRGFRALKVWLGLQQAGRSGVHQMVAEDIELAEMLFQELREHAEFETFTRSLSIATFRYVPRELRSKTGQAPTEEYLNRLNQTLLDEIEKSGEAFVSQAILDGTFLLRACVVNFRTAAADMKALPGIIAALGAKTHSALKT